jgi:hypothetical protein
MKKDAYFFSHDSNSKDDPKCVMLIEQLGLEGYGIFWVLIETLRDQPDYKYPLSLLPAIARRYNSTTQKVEAVVKVYNLFKFTEDEFFFSRSLVNRMEIWETTRLKRSNAGKRGNEIRWNNYKAIAEQSHSDNYAITEQSQNIAKKLNKTKQNESKDKVIDIINAYTENKKLKISIIEFIKMRKTNKKTMTDSALSLLLIKLNKIGGNDDEKIEILNQSIMNCWQGIFELKEGKNGGTKRNNEAGSAYDYDFSKYTG